MVMLLVKTFHCLFSGRDSRRGLAVVMRSEVGLGELGGLWPANSGLSMIEIREEVGTSYGIFAAVVKTKVV